MHIFKAITYNIYLKKVVEEVVGPVNMWITAISR